MNICRQHLDALVKALQHKGMGHLITEDDRLAALKARKWLRGACGPRDFDPMVVSTLEIYQKMTDMGMQPTGCALCALPALLGVQSAPAHWVDNVTDAMLVFARVNKLMLGEENAPRKIFVVGAAGHG